MQQTFEVLPLSLAVPGCAAQKDAIAAAIGPVLDSPDHFGKEWVIDGRNDYPDVLAGLLAKGTRQDIG